MMNLIGVPLAIILIPLGYLLKLIDWLLSPVYFILEHVVLSVLITAGEMIEWQIEAFWRFQIPEELRDRYGYPVLTDADKRKILGLNAARLYGIEAIQEAEAQERKYRPVPQDYESRIPDKMKTLMEFPDFTVDNMSRYKEAYVASEAEPSNLQHGWIRTRV